MSELKLSFRVPQFDKPRHRSEFIRMTNSEITEKR